MNTLEHMAAADAFVRHYRRSPDGDWRQAFADWTRFRRLSPADEAAIRQLAHETLFSLGVTTEAPELLEDTEPPPRAALPMSENSKGSEAGGAGLAPERWLARMPTDAFRECLVGLRSDSAEGERYVFATNGQVLIGERKDMQGCPCDYDAPCATHDIPSADGWRRALVLGAITRCQRGPTTSSRTPSRRCVLARAKCSGSFGRRLALGRWATMGETREEQEQTMGDEDLLDAHDQLALTADTHAWFSPVVGQSVLELRRAKQHAREVLAATAPAPVEVDQDSPLYVGGLQ